MNALGSGLTKERGTPFPYVALRRRSWLSNGRLRRERALVPPKNTSTQTAEGGPKPRVRNLTHATDADRAVGEATRGKRAAVLRARPQWRCGGPRSPHGTPVPGNRPA
ncbi:MAG: hypothetical protein GX117_03665 [Candidatus Hydrogenedentes bacterium]|nr:hypothetical protein [Candidatus Hydrogenedentota bacterium]